MRNELNFPFYGITDKQTEMLVQDILALCEKKKVIEVKKALKMIDAILYSISLVQAAPSSRE